MNSLALIVIDEQKRKLNLNSDLLKVVLWRSTCVILYHENNSSRFKSFFNELLICSANRLR